MHHIDRLSPHEDITRYIPTSLIDEPLGETITNYVLPVWLANQNMDLEDFLGFSKGLMDIQHTLNINTEENKASLKDSDTKLAWFKTQEVVDLRIFFRYSSQDNERAIGSKMRLYSLEKDSDSSKSVIKHIDSGFITSNLNSDIDLPFQKALSSTMFYRSAYCIGGPATVRKFNVPPTKEQRERSSGYGVPSYRVLSMIKPKFTEDFNRGQFKHIISPAAYAAGFDNPEEEIGFDALDHIENIILNSETYEDLLDGIMDITSAEIGGLKAYPDFILTDEDIDMIDEISNSSKANLSGASEKDFGDSSGINLVQTLKMIKKFADEF